MATKGKCQTRITEAKGGGGGGNYQTWGDYKVHVLDCDYNYLRIPRLRLNLQDFSV